MPLRRAHVDPGSSGYFADSESSQETIVAAEVMDTDDMLRSTGGLWGTSMYATEAIQRHSTDGSFQSQAATWVTQDSDTSAGTPFRACLERALAADANASRSSDWTLVATLSRASLDSGSETASSGRFSTLTPHRRSSTTLATSLESISSETTTSNGWASDFLANDIDRLDSDGIIWPSINDAARGSDPSRHRGSLARPPRAFPPPFDSFSSSSQAECDLVHQMLMSAGTSSPNLDDTSMSVGGDTGDHDHHDRDWHPAWLEPVGRPHVSDVRWARDVDIFAPQRFRATDELVPTRPATPVSDLEDKGGSGETVTDLCTPKKMGRPAALNASYSLFGTPPSSQRSAQ